MYKMKNRIERGTGLYAENLRTIAAREIEFRLTPYIFNLGIPPHVSGYNYLRDAVIELLLEPAAQVGVTKCVYPSIAAMYGTTVHAVERSVRHAITSAWNGGGLRRVKGDPQNTILRFHSRPINKKCLRNHSNRVEPEGFFAVIQLQFLAGEIKLACSQSES